MPKYHEEDITDTDDDKVSLDAAKDLPTTQQPERKYPALTDTSLMPFGKYKGHAMQDVPTSYLHWCWHSVADGSVIDYIEREMAALKMENKDLIWKPRRQRLGK
jgi:uncharacterized protein (DUF3820 family)